MKFLRSILEKLKSRITVKTALFGLLALSVLSLTIFMLRGPGQETGREGPGFGELLPLKPKYRSPQKRPANITTDLPESQTLPATAKVYRKAASQTNLEEATGIARRLGFAEEPQASQNSASFRGNGKFLNINFNTGSISYYEPLPDFLKNLDSEALENHSRLLIHELYPNNPMRENIRFKTTHFQIIDIESSTLASQDNADLATVDAFPTIDGSRIIGPADPFGQLGSTEVKFNQKEGSVFLNSRPIILDLAETGNYPIKNLELAKQELIRGEALSMIAVPESQSYRFGEKGEAADPSLADFKNTELVYYFDPEPDTLVQPALLFSGTSLLTDGRTANIYALLPAVSPEHIKPAR